MAAVTRYVGFLRAVNVGARRVAMARLREELEGLGFEDVSTYVNSGNVVFSAPGRPSELEAAIEARLAQVFGFEVETFVRTAEVVREVAARRPFGEVAEGHTHMVVFLRDRPPAAVREAVEAISNDTDRLVVDGREVHWLIHGKVMDSTLKLRDWRALGDQPSTSRNTTMLAKLVTKLGA